ncbi:MAG: pantoate--beta-alanine ligase [Candidatus Endobugula sp.]|jgi:pantoate--beta-alanine ligase
MKIIKTISDLKTLLDSYRQKGDSLGLVPTMGALHDGHISLVKASKIKCTKTIVSIFVNPKQFNNVQDLEKYPKTIDSDVKLLQAARCDVLFLPCVQEMYPFEHDMKISFGELEGNLEGKYRPGHFQGVGIVVSKLFNICQPQSAFFGQKDIQQFYVIKKLIDQLSFSVSLNMVKTAREENGLAMSSRNLRLSKKDRREATIIYECLNQSKNDLSRGVTVSQVRQNAIELFSLHPRFVLEYFDIVEVVNFNTVNSMDEPNEKAICIATQIGGVRLIDNLVLNY